MEEEVVIVGAGIAGLATALALKRVGLRSLVLEGYSELRNTGAAITLHPNAWFALRALGVDHKLIPFYERFHNSRVTNLETGETQVFPFAGTKDSELGVRSVHRKALLDALAEELPPETIRFSSKLVSIKSEVLGDSSKINILQLDDGTIIRAKLLIGCDGVHSVVAQWLGLAEPIRSGRSAVRGLAVFPEGHGFKKEFRQYLSEGVRAGFIPLTNTEVYWFVVNSTMPSEKEISNNQELIMREVRENLVKGFPTDFLSVVAHSDLSSLTWAPLLFRAPWAILLGPAHRASVTVAGDAMHPMVPDLAQGGCSALEDAVVLARCFRVRVRDRQLANIEDGVVKYVGERRWRTTWLVGGSYFVMWMQHGGGTRKGWSTWIVRWFRDKVLYKLVFSRLIDSMWFNCGELQ